MAGGERLGTPGESYSNRTDLNAQPVRTATGQGYGVAAAQRRSQEQLPMGGLPSPPQVGGPSRRPGEPVTAGLPMGAGPGPEALPTAGEDELPLHTARALYARFPSPGLRRLIAQLERG